MSGFMPTTKEIRRDYEAYISMEPGEESYGDAIAADEARARFDRWYAAELRKAKAEALREAADAIEVFSHPTERFSASAIATDLRSRAVSVARADEMEGSEHE